MSKQSSVNYLIEQLVIQDGKVFIPIEVFQKAREMHREEQGNTWDAAIAAHEDRGHNTARSIPDFDDYYNNTFEK